MNRCRTLSFTAVALCLMAGAAAAETGDRVDFAREVLPVLSDTCFQCHGPDAGEGRKGDLRLDEEADLKRDRGGYRVVEEGNAAASELFLRLISEDDDDRMPPLDLGRSLAPEQIEMLRRWIEQGAEWGRHWAFEAVEHPALDPGDGRHPIDVLVERCLDAEGVEPNPRASRTTLIRRLSLDLTGLPPTPEAIDAFLEDEEPGAWERLVDRTLASDAFGERLAWDWMEAARYADTNGYQGDNERTMWPWRDWVVKAFNENLPYDQFTIWQLAGDLLPEATPEQVLATGFNRNHMINGEGGRIAEENRVEYVFDMAETMGTVWLGLTLNCCRCHDHKFDPLTQREYFQFTAFFNQTPVDGKGGDPQTAPVLEVPQTGQLEALAAASAAWEAVRATVVHAEHARFPRNAAQPLASAPGFDALPEPVRAALTKAAVTRKPEEWKVLGDHFAAADAEFAALLREVGMAKAKLDAARAAIPRVMVMDDLEERRPTYVLDHGLYDQPGAEVPAGVPAFLPPLPEGQDADRLDLARWIVEPDHPLTARVTVNRFWQMLFGIGLVKTSEDFGVQSEYPAHLELLDWLAAEFVESGWDVKHLLRTIVLSETYRRSPVIASRAVLEQDPDNRLLARGPRFRMPSWMIRDQALAVSGLLDRTMGGEAVRPYQPEGVWSEATFGKKQYEVGSGSELYRRSLYTFWRRIVGPTLFFDTAKRQVCEVKPLRTNTPMHALQTLNGTTYVEAARILAASVLGAASTDENRFHLLGRRVLGRVPADSEIALWHRSLDRAEREFTADPDAARRFLEHGASPLDPALDPVTHAAWSALCLNLLNLDEALSKP